MLYHRPSEGTWLKSLARFYSMDTAVTVEELVRRWGEVELNLTNLRVAHLERFLFHTYEPESFVEDDFFARLDKWLFNVSDDTSKKLLFQLLPELTYIGPDEFKELYRVAYDSVVSRWLIDIHGIDVLAADCSGKIRESAKSTWFCPVTDSMLINRFFKVNPIPASNSHRPDWRFLFEAFSVSHDLDALVKALQSYIHKHQIKQLVLLEDFVGGGSQTLNTIEFAASRFPGLRVLFVPLIVCPDGANAMSTLASSYPDSLRCEAVMELPQSSFFTATNSPFADRDRYTTQLRDLVTATYLQISDGKHPGDGKPYNPFGFPHDAPTGGMVVMHGNTPDNSLPLIHWRSSKWSPIFPRHNRE